MSTIDEYPARHRVTDLAEQPGPRRGRRPARHVRPAAMSRRHARLEVVTSAYYLGFTYFVRLRASNGSILLTSENYASKSNAKRAALSAHQACTQAGFGATLGARPKFVEVSE